jgi:hypothetical protein
VSEQLLKRRWFQIACGIVLCALLAATVWRIVKQYDVLGGAYVNTQIGMFDFHNGVYQPALGLRNGVIPYSRDLVEKYQVARQAPAYSPFVIASHIPLTYLPLHVAEVVYFLMILAMMAIAAWILIREVRPDLAAYGILPILVVMVASRSGHATLLSGYFTMELVLGTLVALSFAESKPWLSAIGILFASGKPTYALPIGIVMLARGNYRALFGGVGLSIIAALIPLVYLADLHGWQAIVDSLRTGQEDHLADPTEFPVNTWTRIDLAAVVCKWLRANPGEPILILAMLGLIAWPAWKLRQSKTDGDSNGATTPSGAVAGLAILTTLYHHAYDALLVSGATVGLWLSRHRGFQSLKTFERMAIILLATSPGWNMASTEKIIKSLPELPFLRDALSSFNALALTAAIVWLMLRISKAKA